MDQKSSEQILPKIIRNKELKLWIVENTSLIVKSPNNPIVTSFLTPDNNICTELEESHLENATELGLSVK